MRTLAFFSVVLLVAVGCTRAEIDMVNDAGSPDATEDACLPPPCAPPPPNCHYEGFTRCTCGTLVCGPAECDPVVECAAPPEGCNYVGGNTCTCGTLECEPVCDPPVDCARPPVGCAYLGGNTCTCGTLECPTGQS